MPRGGGPPLSELASLGDLAPETVLALATGNNARAFRLGSARISRRLPAAAAA